MIFKVIPSDQHPLIWMFDELKKIARDLEKISNIGIPELANNREWHYLTITVNNITITVKLYKNYNVYIGDKPLIQGFSIHDRNKLAEKIIKELAKKETE